MVLSYWDGVSTFLGYRLLRPGILLVGYFIGAEIAVGCLGSRIFHNDNDIVWLAIITDGLALGSTLYWLQPLGMFAVG
ncbi:hypothetical protein THRCLA_23225 [Thraustotheca clavata]|uniref:Uncharacterized protein n=1 Tax=Thraustotheca clavata TaxID=74557 RepID=A0A1V9Y8Z3_9STRA|nr:hypothetical protein THRCLA_23225 [Thraustotheca clavata]